MPAPEPTTWKNIQDFFGPDEYLSQNSDGELIAVPRILMAAPTIYDVLCGLDFAPGSASAMERWRTQKRTEALVAGVANFSWPSATAGQENRSSIVQFTAGLGVATVGIAVPLITDAAILAAGPKNHILRLQVVNNSLPSLPMGLAAPATGNMPLRYLPGVAALSIPHGQIGVMEIETDGNTIGYVRAARLLGDTVPPIWLLVDDARATGAPVTQLGAGVFAPFLYEGETMLLFMLRTTGTGVTLPTGRGWTFPADGNGLTTGMTSTGADSGLRVAYSTTRGADGVVDGSNTMSNQQYLGGLAYRGVAPTAYAGATTTGTTVAFPSFAGIAPGGFVLYQTCVEQATGVVPAEGVGVHPGGDAPTAAGWTSRLRMVLPDASGNVAPPNVTLGVAAKCHVIAVRMEPN